MWASAWVSQWSSESSMPPSLQTKAASTLPVMGCGMFSTPAVPLMTALAFQMGWGSNRKVREHSSEASRHLPFSSSKFSVSSRATLPTRRAFFSKSSPFRSNTSRRRRVDALEGPRRSRVARMATTRYASFVFGSLLRRFSARIMEPRAEARPPRSLDLCKSRCRGSG